MSFSSLVVLVSPPLNIRGWWVRMTFNPTNLIVYLRIWRIISAWVSIPQKVRSFNFKYILASWPFRRCGSFYIYNSSLLNIPSMLFVIGTLLRTSYLCTRLDLQICQSTIFTPTLIEIPRWFSNGGASRPRHLLGRYTRDHSKFSITLQHLSLASCVV